MRDRTEPVPKACFRRIISVCPWGGKEFAMFRMHKKTKQRVSAVIVLILVAAMLISTVTYLLY